MIRCFVDILAFISLLCGSISAQEKTTDSPFFNIKILPTTPVKSQGSTSTCWVYSTLSMLESEMIRNGKEAVDLSEMYVVRCAYEEKAEKYIRLHGAMSFSGGGEYNDVMTVIKEFGIVPNMIYTGLKTKGNIPDHSDMDNKLKDYADDLAKTPENKTISPVWMQGFNKLLDTYLGQCPEKFDYSGKEYTPHSFVKFLGINPDDYVLITSYTHHPFYEKFILEVPDNWSWGQYYNVPLDELEMIVDSALYKNYTLTWAADVSEKGFQFSKGIAVIADVKGLDSSNNNLGSTMAGLGGKTKVTQELRQREFDNFATTDDHGMQIVGLARDKNNGKYYYVKNSWGTDNSYKGYLYASEDYMRLKTMSVMVNKNALPLNIKRRFKDLN